MQRGIESELGLLNTNLKHRQRVQAARQTLETMQNAVSVSSKIEKRMQEVKKSVQESELSQQSALLERVAIDIERLDSLLKENRVSSLFHWRRNCKTSLGTGARPYFAEAERSIHQRD